jgi:HlyD family secretion protein/macrolide-specific efflux system membrane fusion protein
MKKILKSWWFWILILFLGGGVWWYMSGKETAPRYEVIQVERKTITEIVDATGVVEPIEYADLSFETSGTIEEVFKEVGETVRVGEVLAQIDGASYRSTLEQAQATARIAEADEVYARRNWDDLKPEQREAIKLTSEKARQAAATAASQLEKTYLRAPLDGVITRMDIRVGEYATTGRDIARVSGSEGLHISVDIPESDIAKLSLKQEGTATFDAFGPREKYNVFLSEIEPESNAIQDVVYYTVYFDLKEKEERLRSGMSSDVEIRVAESRNALSLPFRAVYETQDRVFVEILGADGMTIEEKDIEIGLENDEGDIEILSGLKDGDEVVVRSRKEL